MSIDQPTATDLSSIGTELPATLEEQVEAIDLAMAATLSTDSSSGESPLASLLGTTHENTLDTTGKKFIIEWADAVSLWLANRSQDDALNDDQIDALASALTITAMESRQTSAGNQVYETRSPALLIGLLPDGEQRDRFTVHYLEPAGSKPGSRLNAAVASTFDAAKVGRGDIAARVACETIKQGSTPEIRKGAAFGLRLAFGKFVTAEALGAAEANGSLDEHIQGAVEFLRTYSSLPDDTGRLFASSELARGVANSLAMGEGAIDDFLRDPDTLSKLTHDTQSWPIEVSSALLRAPASQPFAWRDSVYADLVNILIDRYPGQVTSAIEQTSRHRGWRDVRDLTLAFARNPNSSIEAFQALTTEVDINAMPMRHAANVAKTLSKLGLGDVVSSMLFNAYVANQTQISIAKANGRNVSELRSETSGILNLLVKVFDDAAHPSPMSWLQSPDIRRNVYEGAAKALEIFATIPPRSGKGLFRLRGDQITRLAGVMRLDGFHEHANRITDANVLKIIGVPADQIERIQSTTRP